MNSCPICSKHQKEHQLLIYSFNHFNLYHSPVESQVLGYVHLEPKRHIEYWHQLTKDEMLEMTSIMKTIELLLIDYVQADRLYAVTISEAVRHLHLHLIPRSMNSLIRGVDLIQQATQQEKKTTLSVSLNSIIDMVQKLRSYLSSDNA